VLWVPCSRRARGERPEASIRGGAQTLPAGRAPHLVDGTHTLHGWSAVCSEEHSPSKPTGGKAQPEKGGPRGGAATSKHLLVPQRKTCQAPSLQHNHDAGALSGVCFAAGVERDFWGQLRVSAMCQFGASDPSQAAQQLCENCAALCTVIMMVCVQPLFRCRTVAIKCQHRGRLFWAARQLNSSCDCQGVLSLRNTLQMTRASP
jgi:hypothetical protein